MLQTAELLKHKLLIGLIYGCGLRCMEVRNIELRHLDFDRKMLHIVQGKGRKDRYVPLSEHLKHGVSQALQSAYPAEKICKDPPLRYFKQQLEAWKTPGFARKFKSGTERFCSPDYAQKMPLLQKRKAGDHCHFRATWSATGFSFRHPNFLCEINFAGKGNYMLKRKITAFKPYKVPLLPTKKAVLLKKLLCVSKF